MTQPLVVNFNGRQYLRAGVTKLAAAVNLAVYDPTHEVEAQKWVAEQLRKKRRVWRDLAEQMDFVLFSSDIPDAQKAVFAIRQKFDKMFDTPVKLIELVDAEQLQTKPVAPEKPVAQAPATAPRAAAVDKTWKTEPKFLEGNEDVITKERNVVSSSPWWKAPFDKPGTLVTYTDEHGVKFKGKVLGFSREDQRRALYIETRPGFLIWVDQEMLSMGAKLRLQK